MSERVLRFARRGTGTYLANQLDGQTGVVVLLPDGSVRPAPSGSVISVLLDRPRREVQWVDAWRVVAGVAALQGRRKRRGVPQLPRDLMSRPVPATNPELPVAVPGDGAAHGQQEPMPPEESTFAQKRCAMVMP